jgi:hypothetical protein
LPSALLAIPLARPDSTARPASTASSSSDLPWLRRSWRLGRSTSVTATSRLRRVAGQSGPVAAGALDADALEGAERAEPLRQVDEAGVVVGNDSTPRTPPLASRAAVTWTSRWASTPPVMAPVVSTIWPWPSLLS